VATFEANAVEMALRAKARAVLEELDLVVRQLAAGLDVAERVEHGAYIAEGRRLFHGDVAPEAPALPANVRALRRDLGVRFKRRPLFDESATYDSQPKPSPERA
jgi:hypothetical protein